MHLNHKLENRKKRVYRPTALISFFTNLQSLSITSSVYAENSPDLMDYDMMVSLPRTLSELTLEFGCSMDCFYPEVPFPQFQSPFLINGPAFGLRKLFDISKLFPNLTKLHVSGGLQWSTTVWSDMMKISFLEELPRSLQSISMLLLSIAGEYNIKRHILSKNLEHLRVHTGTGPGLDLSTLSQLKTLHCNNLCGNVATSLPPNLTELDVQKIYPDTTVRWPKTLTKLSLWVTGAVSDAKWLASLPEHITDLKIMITPELVEHLPRHLRKLDLFMTTQGTEEITFSHFPRELTSLCWNNGNTMHLKVDLKDIPPKLTTLKLNFDERTKLNFLEAIPSTVTDLMLPIATQAILETVISRLNPKTWKLELIMAQFVNTSVFQQFQGRYLHHLTVKRAHVPLEHILHLLPELHTLSLVEGAKSQKGELLLALPPLLRINQ